MALKPCMECGSISDQARCPAHRRGSREARGYDHAHRTERAAWEPAVQAGEVECRRAPYGLCVAPSPLLHPDDPWHLGHPDAACPAAKAPEHVVCNAGAPRRRST